MAPFYNFTYRTKFMIIFYLQRLGAQRSELRFFNFRKIKYKKKVFLFFQVFFNCLWFCVIFLWKQIKNNFLEFATLLAIKFPTKWWVFQPSRSKTVGEDTFLAAKSLLFRRRENTAKHINQYERGVYITIMHILWPNLKNYSHDFPVILGSCSKQYKSNEFALTKKHAVLLFTGGRSPYISCLLFRKTEKLQEHDLSKNQVRQYFNLRIFS